LKPIRNGVRILDSSSLVPVTTPASPALIPFRLPSRMVRRTTRSYLFDRSAADTGCAYRRYTGPAKRLASLPAPAADAANGARTRTLSRGRNQKRCMFARTEVPRRQADSSHVFEACQCLFSEGTSELGFVNFQERPPCRAKRTAGDQGLNGYRPSPGSH
jgi:hypothetical protein